MSRPLLLTEPEAAALLQLCPRTLRKARQEGLLHYVLIGRTVRYTVADLESYIEALRKVQTPCPPSRPAPKSSRSRRQSATIVPFTARRRSA
ncbi:helix-turn-helix domain-containing protein [Novosphingobium sp.]|uniref:helix-turn-helix domain-containing protein n=1 Tax=Novosphingobium sp. TaxID=1874826 RepID=UPI0026296704|nr:helix-turn-helix domain-containing protein [Novosphingobium sp.]